MCGAVQKTSGVSTRRRGRALPGRGGAERTALLLPYACFASNQQTLITSENSRSTLPSARARGSGGGVAEMDAEERAENLARQAEEAEALSAIYGEDFAVEDGAWTVRVPVFRDPERPRPQRLGADGEPLPAFLTARCVPLETYPSRACFLAEVGPSGALDAGELARLAREADAAYSEAPGEVAAFAFVERLREACASAADASATDADDAPERHAEGTENENRDPFDPEALAAELAAIDAGRDAAAAAAAENVDSDDAKNALVAESDIDPSRVRHGTPFCERKSTFQAHVLLRLRSVEEADEFAAYLKRDPKVARASHNVLAFRKRLPAPSARGAVRDDSDSNDSSVFFACDHDDDGEHGAGKGLSHLLRVTQSEDVCVVVTRWFGGVHLGPRRFQCINNAARDALVDAGVAKVDTDGASGSRKSGKKNGVAKEARVTR